MHEGIPIVDNHTPKEYVVEDGKLKGMLFEKVTAEYDDKGKRKLVPTGEDWVFMEADVVLMAAGRVPNTKDLCVECEWAPNTEKLHLESCGVEITPRHYIVVDEFMVINIPVLTDGSQIPADFSIQHTKWKNAERPLWLLGYNPNLVSK